MGYGHSALAALFGFCECDDCRKEMGYAHRKERQVPDPDDWHLWTIRSPDPMALKEHRAEMMEMGFTVGPIQVSDGTVGVPRGFYTFSAKIPRDALSVAEFEALCEWDRQHDGDNDAASGD